MMNENSHDIVEAPKLPQRHVWRDDTELATVSIALSPPSGFRWLFLFGAIVVPFPIAACYIIATREWMIIDTLWDYLGLGICLLIGLTCLWQLPISRISRLLFSVAYVPVMACFLVDFTLGFIGHRYGLWL